MTILEIIQLIIIWLAVGTFICYKRNWYPAQGMDDMPSEVVCFFAVLFAPINLAIVLFRIFFIDKWNNN